MSVECNTLCLVGMWLLETQALNKFIGGYFDWQNYDEIKIVELSGREKYKKGIRMIKDI